MKKKGIFLLLIFLFPLQVFAYSSKLVVGGETIGIEIHASGVYIVDFYKVNNKNIGKDAGFLKGDMIIEVDGNDVHNIYELNKILDNPGKHSFKVNRNGNILDIDLTSYKEDNQIKTGLYVKDMIHGIGTLSYIDPETKVFASLGHEVLESNSNTRFQLNNGYIFDADLSFIHKSSNGEIGELHANILNSVKGNILKNEVNGIYGTYIDDIDSSNLMDIGESSLVEKGNAYIRFQDEDYIINILDISSKEEVKNIFFEIKDERLLESAGGIVQGMSGSPIIQNNKIIGVVNYVVVNDPMKGYGIFIEKMLEEGDLLLKE